MDRSDAAKLQMMTDLEELLNLTEQEMFARFASEAKNHGYSVENHNENWYLAHHIIPGVKPVFITAHVDTVPKNQDRHSFVRDIENWSLKASQPDVIGADDRGGCLIILNLLEIMRDKSVIFCLFNEEETEQIGSKLFCELEDNCFLNVSKLFIGLDRKGFDEYVTYAFDNVEIDAVMPKLGYSKDLRYGKSDVLHLAKNSGTACINLSCGYSEAHTESETAWLYPIFRAIDTLPLLYNILQDKVYPAV